MKDGTHIDKIEYAIANGNTQRMVNLLKTNRDTISLVERLSLAQQCLTNADVGGIVHLAQNQVVASVQIASAMNKDQWIDTLYSITPSLDTLYTYQQKAVDYFVNNIVLAEEPSIKATLEAPKTDRPLRKSLS